MRHRQNSPTENMHPILECVFIDYANQLRAKYPDRKIRNVEVFASGILAFARLGYIELADARTGIRNGIPKFLVDRIKRCRRQPVWIPSTNFPADLFDLEKEIKPSIHGDAVVWRYIAFKSRRISQPKNLELAIR